MRPRNARWFLLLIVLGWLAAAAIFTAGVVKAAPAGCVQQPWLYGGLLGRWTTRTLCDGPIQADGSWLRSRSFYASERYVPVTCSWGRYSGGCSGGYWLPEFDTGTETYTVTPETVLADEPQYIGGQ